MLFRSCSINSYINKEKIERAKILLDSTHMDVQEISDSLNFCSPSYFSSTFRTMIGLSPSDYREQNTADCQIGRESDGAQFAAEAVQIR